MSADNGIYIVPRYTKFVVFEASSGWQEEAQQSDRFFNKLCKTGKTFSTKEEAVLYALDLQERYQTEYGVRLVSLEPEQNTIGENKE